MNLFFQVFDIDKEEILNKLRNLKNLKLLYIKSKLYI